MEQEPLRQCLDCHSRKPRDQFAPRKRTDKHGAKGDPGSRCAPCAEKKHQREHKKRKRVEEGPDLCGDPGEPDFPISLEQLMAQLREEALTGSISCSTRVSTQGLSGEADEICSIVIGHVWEATGFRFTCRRKYTLKNGTVRRMYECCQSTASTNNRPKMEPEHDKQCRDTRRMARFPCNGVFHVTLWDGYFDCVLNHSLDHVHYTDISIPDKWHEFIKDNYELGPTNIWREILQKTDGGNGIAFTQKAVRYAWLRDGPSPSRPHPTGVDGILGETEPSGFSQPLSRQERFATLVANLEKLINYIKSQEHQASLEWLDNMEGLCKPAFKFMEDHYGACEPPYIPEDQ